MKLIELTLTNFRQHASKTAKFSPGLTAVVGSNGSGKSNLLLGALAALGGPLPPGSSKASIRQGSQGPASVALTVSIGGKSARFVRSLHPSFRRLDVGETKLTTEADISDAVLSWTGLTPDLLATYAFVPQGRLADLFLATKSERTDALNQLFGLDRADRIWAALGKILSRPIPDDPKVMSSASEVVELEQTIESLQARLGCLVGPPPEEVAAAEEAIRTARTRGVLFGRIGEYKRRIQQADLAANAPVSLVDGDLEDTLDAESKARAAAQRVKVVRSRKPALDTDRPTMPWTDEQIQEMKARFSTLSKLVDALRSSPDSAVCSVCSAPVADPASLRKSLSDELRQLNLDLQTHALLQEQMDIHLASVAWKKQYEEAVAEQEAAEKAIAGRPSSAKIIEARRAKDARDNQVELARTLRLELQSAEEEYAALPEDVPNAAKILSRHRQVETEKSEIRAQMSAYQQTLIRANARLAEAVKIDELRKRLSSWHARASRLRSVFARDALPSVAARGRMEELLPAVNATLSDLGASFQARLSETELTYDLVFKDRVVPAHALSGGEKVLLGLAWRLAVCWFSSDGSYPLVLDEPTEGLDETRRDCLRSSFRRLRDLCGERDLQIVFATHDPALAAEADSIIDLS